MINTQGKLIIQNKKKKKMMGWASFLEKLKMSKEIYYTGQGVGTFYKIFLKVINFWWKNYEFKFSHVVPPPYNTPTPSPSH